MLRLRLDYWDGLAFDESVRQGAVRARQADIRRIYEKANKDAGGMDVIAGLVAMVARG